jgi:UDP:flavonoid glycosyltransferase YjiC (YdhE family)
MDASAPSEKKPLVGFFPVFYNLAETGRAVTIAKRYMELGGEAIFFSHGGEYEYLARNIGCEVIRVNPLYSKEFIDLNWKAMRFETLKNPYTTHNIIEYVKEEVSAYKKTGIKLIVSTNNITCGISAKIMKIPLIFVRSRFYPRFTYYPEDAEILFTYLLPKWLKLKIFNWCFLNSRHYAPPFIKIAKHYNVTVPKNDHELSKGDHTFYTDFQQLAEIEDHKPSPNEYYIGPIFFDELFEKKIDKGEISTQEEIIRRHLKRDGKSILLSLGSSGTKEFFIKLLKIFNKTNYNVIAVYTSILQENELPVLNENILLMKFVPSLEKLIQRVDLAIIHGGQGTVYTAAYAGKPIIGFPMFFEQHSNLEMLARQGVAKIASRKSMNEQHLLREIKDMFEHYDTYLTKAQELSKTLPQAEGDKNAARIICRIASKLT